VTDVHATESSNPKEASHANSGTWTLSSGSGALGQLDVTWALRTERPDRKMSLEGLIAAAQAWEQIRRPAGAYWASDSDGLRVGLDG
jgi:hypothetical protein